ncbi:TatD family hydrolase [Opitutales bacterium ASA1]|uniref:TatD family hydrolase n=1 Tax=Congregicoccus parvus TaxID=3081749 RepID=UPI002B2EEE0D|nr:TatD family hydrolase [Opitutales bacterium ASA1]
MALIDSHTHLEGFHRAGETAAILARAREAGVETLITIGTEPQDWETYREIERAEGGYVRHTLGLHPCSVDEHWQEAAVRLRALLDERLRPVAVGETGLDRFHLPKHDSARAEQLLEWQRDSFRTHLEIAARHDLPVVVHSRGATSECVEMIDAAGFDWSRVVFHCWVDDASALEAINRRGGRGSFTGIATYKSATIVREAARQQGLERVMVETDAPYLTPEPHRGKRNEPAFVAHTAAALAREFGVSTESFAEIATRNTREFFRLG